jgi:hypothetical protein
MQYNISKNAEHVLLQSDGTPEPMEPLEEFTEAQLAEVRQAALDRGFRAFKDETGRTIYLDEDAPDGLEILMFDSECVWLDRYTQSNESIKAESDGTASTIVEIIATMKQESPEMEAGQ